VPELPMTGRTLDTEALLRLEVKAAELDLSQRLPEQWLREEIAADAVHYAVPVLVHQLTHRPELPDQFRCLVFLETVEGERIQSLLDILPHDFDALPAFSKAEQAEANRLVSDKGVRTQRQHSDGAT